MWLGLVVLLVLPAACAAPARPHYLAVHAGDVDALRPTLIVESARQLSRAQAETFLRDLTLDTDGDDLPDTTVWDTLAPPVHITPWSPTQFAAWEIHHAEMRRRLTWRWPDPTWVLRVRDLPAPAVED